MMEQPHSVNELVTAQPYNNPASLLVRQPTKLIGRCLLISSAVCTLLMIALFVAGVVICVKVSLGGIALIIIGFIVYGVPNVMALLKVRKFLNSAANSDTLNQRLQTLKRSPGYIALSASCYHEAGTEDGNTEVVTHTAKNYIMPRQCLDQTPQLPASLKDECRVISTRFVAKMMYSDPRSQDICNRNFYEFKQVNSRDTHQRFSCDWECEGLASEVVCFTDKPIHWEWGLLWFFLGGQFFYLLWVQTETVYYIINLTKRITL